MILAYAARRLLAAIPVMIGVALTTFLLIYLVPGDPARVILGENAGAEQVAQLRAELGLDQPIHVRFINWLGGILTGDFGDSPFLVDSVGATIARHASVSFTLAVGALIAAVILGICLGILAALWRGRLMDRVLSTVAVGGVALPNFVFAVALVAVFAVGLGWLPASGFVKPWEDPVASIRTLALPVIALGLKEAAQIARMMRGSMIEALESEYVLAAHARGLSRWRAILVHALTNAMGPTIMIIGITFGSLVSGMIIIESIFGIPGLGRLIIDGVRTRDVVLLQGVMFVVAGLYVLATLIADIAQARMNPRVAL